MQQIVKASLNQNVCIISLIDDGRPAVVQIFFQVLFMKSDLLSNFPTRRVVFRVRIPNTVYMYVMPC